MEPAEKLSITLPANLARIVRQKVESGAYASNSEVIREALRAWQEREMERERQLNRSGTDSRRPWTILARRFRRRR